MKQAKSKTTVLSAFIVACLTATGCTTTTSTSPPSHSTASEAAVNRQELTTQAKQALERLYQHTPEARALVKKASGVLVFPVVTGGSLIVGSSYGKGVLLTDGKPERYYRIATGSVGLQAGAQSQSTIMLFMTREALDKFRASSGWTAGLDASVVVASRGANGRLDPALQSQPIISFVFNNAGLMAGLSFQGQKITPVSD